MKAILCSLLLVIDLLVIAAPGESISPPSVYCGICDASAVEALNAELFVVADDEDNNLRVYSRFQGGLPLHTVNLTSFLRLRQKAPEVDIEGAARIGDRIYWISSHGANSAGKVQESRQRFFATTGAAHGTDIDVRPIGQPYVHLLRDLAKDPRFAAFGLTAAARRAPKSPGALNIEGLAATPEGHLLIGFRNPIPNGQALIIPLLNPADLIEGRPARFGDPMLLELGGLGIRSISRGAEKYMILAGSFDEARVSVLYEWDGLSTTPQLVHRPEMAGINPEGITFFQDNESERMWIVSDEGTVKITGIDCKRLKDQTRKQYHAVSLAP